MTNEIEKKDNLHAITQETSASDLGRSGGFRNLFYFFVGVAFVVVAVWGGVFFFFKDYVKEVVIQESVVRLDQIKRQFEKLETQFETMRQNNLVETSAILQKVVDLEKKIQLLELKLKEVEVGVVRAQENQAKALRSSKTNINLDERLKLIEAIQKGEDLEPFIKNANLPEPLNLRLAQVGRFPPLKEVLSAWASVKPALIAQIDLINQDKAKPLGWIESFKLFLFKLFRVRVIDAAYLTEGEKVARNIDGLLTGGRFSEIPAQLKAQLKEGDVLVEKSISDWFAMVEFLGLGVELIETIKNTND
jgi:hypothetical protein